MAAWKKGESGNPAGRPPRGSAWAELAREIGDEIVGGVPRRRQVLLAVYDRAMGGDLRAAEFLAELEHPTGSADILGPLRLLTWQGEGD